MNEIRTRLLLWALAGAVIVVYGALGFFALRSRGPTATVTEVGFTAKTAYPLAEEAAKGWREDAQLLSATAAWGEATEKELASGKTSWGFYFLSPLARQIKAFSVSGESATGTKTFDLTSTPQGIDLSRWQVDSPEAIKIFLDQGGRDFLARYPGAAVHLRLAAQEDGRLVWTASGLSSQDKSTFSLEIDATTGEVSG